MALAVLLALAPGAAAATDLAQPSLADLQWVARPIVVFADSANDPRLAQQLESFEARAKELEARDVVILVDTDPAAGDDLRSRFRPRGFNVLVLGKDGQVKYRKPNPVSVKEVIRLIDRMPLRQQEMRASGTGAGN
ncbi:MAG: DUF4174 domain-containing protein [Pseudomonadota bacterium]